MASLSTATYSAAACSRAVLNTGLRRSSTTTTTTAAAIMMGGGRRCMASPLSSMVSRRSQPLLSSRREASHFHPGVCFVTNRYASSIMPDKMFDADVVGSSSSNGKISNTSAATTGGKAEASSSPQPPPKKEEDDESWRKPLNDLPVTYADIARARVSIRDGIVKTTCEKSFFLSEICGANVYLKSEFRQFTGSFKERGARNAIKELIKVMGGESKNVKGVIAASAGNHALALAYHGQQLGVPVTVVMPTVAPLAKVDKCRKFGARIIIHGQHIGEAKVHAEGIVAKEGIHYINGYDDPEIVAGAGTIGVEIVEAVPDVDAVVVPVGGAGLIAGISCAVKTLKPDCKVIGVEPVFCASYLAALAAGKPVAADVTPTLADGLAVPVVGPHAFEVARHYVDECVTITEKDISLAVLRLIENEKMVVEGGGAAGLGALLPGAALDREDLKGKNIVVPLCGGNIDTTTLGRVMERGLAADNRLTNFTATVSDRPGGIARLTALLSEEGASIKDIYHERAWLYTHVDQVNVKCVVELNGRDHAIRLKQALLDKGYPVVWNPEQQCV